MTLGKFRGSSRQRWLRGGIANSCSDFLNVTFFPGLNKVMPLKFAKPIRRKIEKTNRRKVKNAHIARTRQLVLKRDRRCRACASTVFLEMHEMKSRSQLRGKPPEEIFNSFNCIMLCSTCHRQVTERIIKVTCPQCGHEW